MEAQLSAPGMVLVTLDSRLEECTDPEDEDVVRGILAQVFSILPPVVGVCKYDEFIKQNCLAEVSELRELTRADLTSLGVPLGHVKKILRLVQPAGSAQPSSSISTVVGQRPTIKKSMKAIPALGANALPSRRPWAAYESVFTAGLGLHQLPEERIKLVSEGFLNPLDPIGSAHVGGCGSPDLERSGNGWA